MSTIVRGTAYSSRSETCWTSWNSCEIANDSESEKRTGNHRSYYQEREVIDTILDGLPELLASLESFKE